MVASAPETVIAAEHVTAPGATVIVEPRVGLGSWFRSLGRSIGTGFGRFFSWVGNTATNTVHGAQNMAGVGWDFIKSAGNWLWGVGAGGVHLVGSTASYVGSRLYWSGAAVGRGFGRTMRFFGRGARTLAVGTPRYLLRTTGWSLRLISLVFRTVLEFVFSWVFMYWVGLGVLIALLAWSHRAYDNQIHRRTVRLSTGNPDAATYPFVDPKQEMGDFIEVADARIGHWAEGDVIVGDFTVVDDKPMGETHTDSSGAEHPGVSIDTPAGPIWVPTHLARLTDADWEFQSAKVPAGWDIGLSHTATVQQVEAFIHDMQSRFRKEAPVNDKAAFLLQGVPVEDVRLGFSYWFGRMEGLALFIRFGTEVWDDEKANLSGSTWAALYKEYNDRHAFDRESDKAWRLNSTLMKRGFDDEILRCRRAVEWRDEEIKAGRLAPDFSFGTIQEEAPNRPVSKTARKAPVRKSTPRRS